MTLTSVVTRLPSGTEEHELLGAHRLAVAQCAAPEGTTPIERHRTGPGIEDRNAYGQGVEQASRPARARPARFRCHPVGVGPANWHDVGLGVTGYSPAAVGKPFALAQALTSEPAAASPADTPASAARARAIVMETERRLGFEPTDRELKKLGYDIESRVPTTGALRFLEVTAAAVRGPKHVVRKNATPVLSPAETRALLRVPDQIRAEIHGNAARPEPSGAHEAVAGGPGHR